MRCRKVQRKLSGFLDGELSGKKAARIAEHLSHCSRCQQEAAALSSAWEQLGKVPEIEFSPYFWTRLSARIAQAEQQRFALGKVWRALDRLLVPTTVIAASVVGLWVGGSLYDIYQEDQPQPWEQVAEALHLDALDDFPGESIGLAYMELMSDQGE